MNIIFSTPWSAIESECDTKFPTYNEEDATKNLLFARLRDSSWTPVRFLGFSGDASMYDVLVDVPGASSVDDVDQDVLPFTCAAG